MNTDDADGDNLQCGWQKVYDGREDDDYHCRQQQIVNIANNYYLAHYGYYCFRSNASCSDLKYNNEVFALAINNGHHQLTADESHLLHSYTLGQNLIPQDGPSVACGNYRYTVTSNVRNGYQRLGQLSFVIKVTPGWKTGIAAIDIAPDKCEVLWKLRLKNRNDSLYGVSSCRLYLTHSSLRSSHSHFNYEIPFKDILKFANIPYGFGERDIPAALIASLISSHGNSYEYKFFADDSKPAIKNQRVDIQSKMGVSFPSEIWTHNFTMQGPASGFYKSIRECEYEGLIDQNFEAESTENGPYFNHKRWLSFLRG